MFYLSRFKDYNYAVRCMVSGCECEETTIPIEVIGARACLDIPPEISFCCCPVRYDNEMKLTTRNIGARLAYCTLYAEEYAHLI